MESLLNPSLKQISAMAINQKLIMQGVGWDFYEQILADYINSNALHFAYNDGILEVEMPKFDYEKVNRFLLRLIEYICLELNLDFANAGSTTFRQQKKTKGCEPDTAFYLANATQVRDLDEIDLTFDPPPDLVIEVDMTSPSLDKMPIYAALNVPEVWLYQGQKVEFFHLVGEKYKKVKSSISIPILSSEKATQLLQKGLTVNPKNWFQEVHEWANSQK